LDGLSLFDLNGLSLTKAVVSGKIKLPLVKLGALS
jgi:hypothetical protein